MDAGDEIHQGRADWSFAGDVAETFVPHIRKSVPFYDEGHTLVCHLSDFFCERDSVAYELGSSTGQLVRRLAEHNAHKPRIRWVGIEQEEAMMEKAREHCAGLGNVELLCDDITTFPFESADLIVAYYTMQFTPERVRQELFDRIYESLNWGGGFVLFEKVRAPDARFQDMTTTLYHEFKMGQGFTAEQIMNKMTSLKGVLDPFSTQGNLDLLARAGFKDVMTVFKYICFEGFLAIK